jgi:outer membrane immunogenic protein
MRGAVSGCFAAVVLFGCDVAAAGDLAPYTQGFPSNFTPAPVYNWSGFYVGAIGGGSIGIARHLFTDLTVDTGDFRVDGGLFGASFGLNYQTGPWVWGLDGDIAWTAIGGSQNVAAHRFRPIWIGSTRSACVSAMRSTGSFLISPWGPRSAA